MSTNPLDQSIVISNGTLTLTANTLPGISLDDLLVAYNGGQPLVINDAQKQSADGVITVTGTASFMRVPSLPVTAVFTMDATNKAVATLRFTLIGDTISPTSWRFSQSFPTLPDFPGAKPNTPSQPNYLDTLAIRNAAFILTTSDGKDQATGVPLVSGLNFVAQFRPQGFIGILGALLDSDPEVPLYGPIVTPKPTEVMPALPARTYPWHTRWTVPGIMLQADLGVDFSISNSSLNLKNLIFRVFCPVDKDWLAENKTYVPARGVTCNLNLPDANISSELTALFFDNFPALTLSGTFDGVTLDNLSSLSGFAGGDDLFNALPDQVKQFGPTLGGMALEALGISFMGSLAPVMVYITVGIPNAEFSILPGFTVKKPFATFTVNLPFATGRTVSVIIGGTIDTMDTSFLVSVEMPGPVGRASLQEDATIPLSKLCAEVGLEPPADLTVNVMQMVIGPNQGYSFTAVMADDPPWALNIGPTPMVIKGINTALSKDASGSSGRFSGSIMLDDGLSFDVRYDLPGEFYIRAELPNVKLSQLIAYFDELGLELPKDFDLTLQQSWVLIEKQVSGLRFTAATTVDNLGLVAFTTQKAQRWGFAVGVDLNAPNVVALPGLEALAPFQTFFGLDKLMLVASSLDDAGFSFPSMANFNVPPLANKAITLPPQASGLTRGMNIYARLNTTTSQAFRTLANFLNIKLDGSVGVTLAVSLPDPASNSKLFIAVDQEIQKGTTLKGMLGGLLTGGQVGAFMTGVLNTQIQNQQIQFDATTIVLANGVLISGTMKGGPIHFDMIPAELAGSDSLPVQLSNVALVIGIDWEGIPSFGFAATLDVGNFDSSVALFINSVNPAQSMFAGAVSNLNLADVAKTFAGQNSLPPEVSDIFSQVSLKGLSAFQMPASVAPALDGRDLVTIANSFKQFGNITIPSNNSSIMLVINTAGSVWHVTDLTPTAMRHYSLTRQGDQIAVDLQAQVYCVPQDTFIGSLQYRQGFEIEADINFFMLQARIKALIKARQGISADVDVNPIIIFNRDFFAVTDASGQAGPHLSLASFSQPTQTDPNLRGPHFLLTGKLRLLGVDVSSTYISVSSKGLVFSLEQQLTPVLFTKLQGSFTSLSDLNASGTANVGIDRQLDLGVRGQVRIQMMVNGTLKLGYDGNNAFATYQGSFDFHGVHGEIPPTTLNVTGQALANIADTVWGQVSDIISKALLVADQWLKWVGDNTIPGLKSNAEQVGKALNEAIHLPADQIASKTQQFLNYGSSQIATALHGAGVPVDQAIKILEDLKYGADEISKAITSAFAGQKVNITLGHVDTPAGPHVDTPAAPHADTPAAPHVDVQPQHVDQKVKFIGHTDKNVTPHVDTKAFPHVDTPAFPHVDGPTPPHVDTGTHIDI